MGCRGVFPCCVGTAAHESTNDKKRGCCISFAQSYEIRNYSFVDVEYVILQLLCGVVYSDAILCIVNIVSPSWTLTFQAAQRFGSEARLLIRCLLRGRTVKFADAAASNGESCELTTWPRLLAETSCLMFGTNAND